jgi:hypothetical protein
MISNDNCYFIRTFALFVESFTSHHVFFHRKFKDPVFFDFRLICLFYMFRVFIGIPYGHMFSAGYSRHLNTYIGSCYQITRAYNSYIQWFLCPASPWPAWSVGSVTRWGHRMFQTDLWSWLKIELLQKILITKQTNWSGHLLFTKFPCLNWVTGVMWNYY